MANEEDGRIESNKIVKLYSDFMTRVSNFEELSSIGNRLLIGFQQALGFLGRPPISKTSVMVDQIIRSHGTKRLLSYMEGGCRTTHDSAQHVSKFSHMMNHTSLFHYLLWEEEYLFQRKSEDMFEMTSNINGEVHMCHRGLQDHVNKAKTIINELECLLDDATSAVRAANAEDTDFSSDFNLSITSCDVEELPSPKLSSKVTDYAAMMAFIYSMVEQDYTMQARIISSLNLETSPEQLETYCQMWSLRPFVDDDLMHKAWGLIK